MKSLKALSYTSPREAIAEKFHMSEGCCRRSSRQEIRPGGRNHFRCQRAQQAAKLTIGRIEIDRSRQTVKALDPSGALIGFFPATVGSEEKPTPGALSRSSQPTPTRTIATTRL